MALLTEKNVSPIILAFTVLPGLLAYSCTDTKQCEIPVIRVDAEEFSGESKDPCVFDYTDCDKQWSVDARIRVRGNSSSHFNKRSYTVKLPDKRPLAGLPADNDWIVNASYIDKTFMRHKLSFDLFRAMNPRNVAPQSAYIEVFENEKYMGLYVLMERLDGTRLGLNKKDSTAFIFKDPPLLYDHTSNWDRDSLTFEAQKFPNQRKGNRTAYLKQLEALIMQSDDNTFSREIVNLLDIDNLIDWQLILLLANNSDGQHKNYFIFRTDSLSPARIALWDCDHGFGRDGDNEYNMLDRPVDKARMTLFRRLMELNPQQYNERMHARWAELRQHLFTLNHLEQEINTLHSEIEPYIAKNAAQWPNDGPGYFDDNNYDQEVEIIREFLRIQIPRLDAHFEYHP